jgi:hypothetical protein
VGLPAVAPERREQGEVERVERRLVGGRHEPARVLEDERLAVAVPVGHEVREQVELEPVAEQRIVLHHVQRVEQAQPDRQRNDRPEGDRKAAERTSHGVAVFRMWSPTSPITAEAA